MTDPAPFAPAEPRPRSDGWTPDRQRLFIEALAAWGSVRGAADHVGLSPSSAYRLRSHPKATAFRAAWAAAEGASIARLTDIAMERVRDGVAVPVFHKGEAVGERRVYSDRLLMFMLTRRDALRYEKLSEVVEFDTSRLPNPDDTLGRALAALEMHPASE